jgi:hypothetical protein
MDDVLKEEGENLESFDFSEDEKSWQGIPNSIHILRLPR